MSGSAVKKVREVVEGPRSMMEMPVGTRMAEELELEAGPELEPELALAPEELGPAAAC